MKKSDLINALTMVKPGLSNKEIIEQASSFAFLNGRVITYNDEISISHPLEDLSFEGVIKAEILYGLLSKIKTEEIELIVKENELLIKAGRTKAGIIFQQEIKLPLDEIIDERKWKKLPVEFSKYMKFAADACSNDMSIPIMNCVHVAKNGVFQSSDNYKIVQVQLKGEMPVDSFLIPASSSVIVSKMDPIYISEGLGWIHFKTKDDTIISCRVFEDSYPNIDPLLKVKGISLSLPSTLPKVLERAGIFSKRDHVIDETITIMIEKKRFFVKAKSENGWFEESLNTLYEGDPITFNITPYLLQDIISETLECIISSNCIKFETKDWEYISILKN